MKWARHVTSMEETKNTYKIVVGKLEWKRLRGRFRSGLEDNVRIDLREIGWEGVDVTHLAQNWDQ
jgi:hypothetical protein